MEPENGNVLQTGQGTGSEETMMQFAQAVGPVEEMMQSGETRARRRWGLWVSLLLLLVAAVGAVIVVLNREWIYDFYRGMSYEPSAEMSQIRDKLKLTKRGEFVFKAARPELSESEEFNEVCRSVTDTEVAILGCYAGGDVYVYNIVAEELAGIRELTTAHELLHAVYARMSDEDKSKLESILREVYDENEDVLVRDLGNYVDEEKAEELYVRAGTEIKNLPAELEKHYAEIFQDQDLIVGFYESYIAVFREIEAEMEGLKAEMEAIDEEVVAKIDEYEQRLAQFNANVVSFNACAEVAGCFGSEEEFELERGVLLEEQDALDELYDAINELVDEYNAKVEEYNEDVTQSEKLNRMINSVEKVEEVE